MVCFLIPCAARRRWPLLHAGFEHAAAGATPSPGSISARCNLHFHNWVKGSVWNQNNTLHLRPRQRLHYRHLHIHNTVNKTESRRPNNEIIKTCKKYPIGHKRSLNRLDAPSHIPLEIIQVSSDALTSHRWTNEVETVSFQGFSSCN